MKGKIYLIGFVFILLSLILTSGQVVIKPSNTPGFQVTINNGGGTSGNLTNFTELLDTPDSYAGNASNCVVVNSSATGLAFTSCTAGGTFNITYHNFAYNQTVGAINILNGSYHKWWYNQSDGVGTGNASWNQSLAETLFASIIWAYNQTNASINILNGTYGKFWYNMTDGVGSGNTSWNQSLADTLYSSIIWGYNQSLFPITTLNGSYNKWWYNQTVAAIYTNGSGILLNNNQFNLSTAFTDLLYAGIEFDYNQTVASINILNGSYNKWWYNQSDGVGTGNASWNQSLADTLYASIIWGHNQSTYAITILNGSYNKWWYNQTDGAVTSLNGSYGKFWYNQSDGAGGNSSWNESYANTLYAGIEWDYNQTVGAINILNGSYNKWWYNQTLGSVYTNGSGILLNNNKFNLSTAFTDTLYSSIIWGYNQSLFPITTLNNSYNKWWYNQSLAPVESDPIWNGNSTLVGYKANNQNWTANNTQINGTRTYYGTENKGQIYWDTANNRLVIKAT